MTEIKRQPVGGATASVADSHVGRIGPGADYVGAGYPGRQDHGVDRDKRQTGVHAVHQLCIRGRALGNGNRQRVGDLLADNRLRSRVAGFDNTGAGQDLGEFGPDQHNRGRILLVLGGMILGSIIAGVVGQQCRIGNGGCGLPISINREIIQDHDRVGPIGDVGIRSRVEPAAQAPRPDITAEVAGCVVINHFHDKGLAQVVPCEVIIDACRQQGSLATEDPEAGGRHKGRRIREIILIAAAQGILDDDIKSIGATCVLGHQRKAHLVARVNIRCVIQVKRANVGGIGRTSQRTAESVSASADRIKGNPADRPYTTALRGGNHAFVDIHNRLIQHNLDDGVRDGLCTGRLGILLAGLYLVGQV